MVHAIEMDLAGRRLRLETGRVAKQADGAVLATYGDTVVLATAVGSQTWQAKEKSTSGGTLTNLGASPAITVT